MFLDIEKGLRPSRLLACSKDVGSAGCGDVQMLQVTSACKPPNRGARHKHECVYIPYHFLYAHILYTHIPQLHPHLQTETHISGHTYRYRQTHFSPRICIYSPKQHTYMLSYFHTNMAVLTLPRECAHACAYIHKPENTHS